MMDKKRWKRFMIYVLVWIIVFVCAFYFAPTAC